MTYRFAMGATLAIAIAASVALAEDKASKSGLQVGESPTPFNPLHCNGKLVGKKNCLV
jgi:hypothetical protein